MGNEMKPPLETNRAFLKRLSTLFFSLRRRLQQSPPHDSVGGGVRRATLGRLASPHLALRCVHGKISTAYIYSRHNLACVSVCVLMCAPHVMENNVSEIRPRACALSYVPIFLYLVLRGTWYV